MIPISALGGSRPPGPGQMGGGEGMQPGGFNSNMIPLGSLGGAGGGGGGGGNNMVPLGSLGGSGGMPRMGGPDLYDPEGAPMMEPPPGGPPNMSPPSGAPEMQGGPPSFGPGANNDYETTLAEVGKSAKDYLDPLMPIAIPEEMEDSRPVPKQVQKLENGTDIFKMFDVDAQRFDPKAVRKGFHKMAALVNPEKLGRKPTPADEARWVKLKQAYTVIMDEQLRAVYRQHCFGIAGSGGTKAEGHDAALGKALVLGRELRKMSEERAIVLHKASETGWSQQQKDQDGRTMRGENRKHAHQFNLFADISSSEDEDAELEKERRGLEVKQILEKSPKYADSFLDRAMPLLQDLKVSKRAAGGAFTMLDKPLVAEWLAESPKTVQKLLRKLRTSVKQMNWAMTSLLQNKDSPWRGLEVRASLVEHSTVKMLDSIRSGLAFGKFNEVHHDDFSKLLDNIHKLYMDLFEKRGQDLLRGAINAELDVVYKLPESEGRLPEGSRIILQDLVSRNDLNGKGGTVTGWDYSLQRYTIEPDRPKEREPTNPTLAPANPDLLAMGDEDLDGDDDEEEQTKVELAIPKKMMVLRKNVMVDLDPCAKNLTVLMRDWNTWRRRARSVSATQDAEAVAAALGPPLESMANFIQEAASAVSTASACGRDGADLIADECREALQNARNLAAKLLGEEPKEPPAPPPLNEPPPVLAVAQPMDEQTKILKEAAEVAQAGIEISLKKKSRSRGRRRSRSRRRRRRHSSSED